MPEAEWGKIHIKNLVIWTMLGVFPDERLRRRPITLDLVLTCDLARAIASDSIDDAVNYAQIRDAVVAQVENSTDQLLERLASKVADTILAFGGVREVSVTATKPSALADCDGVSIEIVRQHV